MRAGAAVCVPLLLVGALLAVPDASAQQPPPADPGNLQVEAGVAPGTPVPDPRPGEAFADPKVADLQHTASDVQRELGNLAGQIRTAQDGVNAAGADLRRATAERQAAEAVVAAQQKQVDEFSRSVFTAMGRPDALRMLLTAANAKDLFAGTSMINHLRAAQDAQLTGALDRQRKAADAEHAAAGVEQAAAGRKADLDRRSGDAVNRADAISSELRGPINAANDAVIAQQQAQKDRDGKTAANWKAYTDRLAAAGITPPPAVALRDPAHLPAGMTAVPGTDGAPQPGVAQVSSGGQRLLVLPKETVAAVTAGIGALGKPFVPHDGGGGPVAYSCDGLAGSVFGGAGLPQPGSAGEQFAVGQPVPVADAQPGDLAFIGPAKYGVQSVGIVLDQHTMLAADARLAGVVVADLPAGDSLLGVARPALGPRPAQPVPQRANGELTWRCGGVEMPPRTFDGSAADEAAGAWGGYPNGLIPPRALCSIGTGSHVLRCDAAQTFIAMSQAYAGVFGTPMCVTDSYRAFDQQVNLYREKPSLAAVPGTSNHGWGLAVDLCGGAQSFGTPEYDWLSQNSRAFGWVHPGWARAGGGREEPWHWEFAGR
jgi:cell wall-associated NlpC family hydrolase